MERIADAVRQAGGDLADPGQTLSGHRDPLMFTADLLGLLLSFNHRLNKVDDPE